MIARQISFFAPAAVMSAWGAVMLHTLTSGHIKDLLSPMFRSYVLVASLLLFALSILYLLLYQPTSEPAPALAPTGRLRQLGRWAMLLVPVVAASVLSPSALSNTTLANRGAFNSTYGVTPMPSFSAESQDSAKAALVADPNQPVPVEVTDLVTISKTPAQIQAFDGRKVRVVGLFVNEGGSPKLVRLVMWCCAADALPFSVDLSGNTAGNWKENQWLEVTGTAQFPATLGHVTPQIEVDSIKPAQEPDEPYLSP